jgi:hypothetical protein
MTAMTHEAIRLLKQEIRQSKHATFIAAIREDYITSNYHHGYANGLERAITIISDYFDLKGTS